MMRRDGRLVYAPNLQSALGRGPGALLGVSLASSMVFCENDANCAALCEHEWGAGRGIDDFVMVTLGTGIGGGVIADGQLIRGHSGFAGEIGHMVVVARGAACSLRWSRLLGALRLGRRTESTDARSRHRRTTADTRRPARQRRPRCAPRT